MAHPQSAPFLGPQGDASPVEGPEHDFPPPPPAHRVPVGAHADSQHYPPQRPSFQNDPNVYSDLSTPGSEGRDAPLGVPSRSPNGTPFSNEYPYDAGVPPRSMYSNRSFGSQAPLAGAGMYSSNHSLPTMNSHGSPFSDNPYNRYSTAPMSNAHTMGAINPNEVADDDDWGMGPETTQNKRRSFVPGFGASRDGSRNGSPGSSIASGVAGAGAGAAVGAGAAAGVLAADGSGKYNAVANAASANESGSNLGGHSDFLAEKSEWLRRDHAKRKKRMWIAMAIIAVILLGAILGGVLGALLKDSGGHSNSNNGVSAGDVATDNKDDLNKDSSEIKALMNNANLHKVFPGMDYTPLNSQMPACDKVPPSQNNITRDVAVMSQLTNSIRLYGTDCNQTQMVIHAIERLELTDMKIWLGVWLDDNNSTNKRQIAQTWDILDQYGCDHFRGIIIGNEVLYRKDLTATELIDQITVFRKNITNHKCDLPVAMADLGDNWTADMASKVDIVMSNVHPFFAGVQADQAAAWTWDFWNSHDVSLTATDKNIKQVIAEVGWPSGGGTSCGGADTCTEGSVAGVDELNQFMEDWVCPSLKNQTEYFW